MNLRQTKTFLTLALCEGLFALAWALLMPAPLNRARNLSHQLVQAIAVTLIGLVILGGTLLLMRLYRDPLWGERATSTLDRWLTQAARVIVVKDFIVVGLIFSIEWFLLTYLSIPVAFRPILLWAALICVQAWIFLSRAYRDLVRGRSGGLAALRAGWAGLEPSQHTTIMILLFIATIYFGLFAFINWHGISENAATFFAASGDEVVIYPIATEMVSPAPDVAGQVYRFFVYEDYHYGYPFYYFSALLLTGSRLVFGPAFVNQTQLNLFLLRQFVSVLPLILALLMLVYLVTRFQSMFYSVSIFIVLLLIPGVIRYNQQFWHPDGLQLLFIVLTFYYLQRDQLKFGRAFYYAALMCGLAAATKLYGFFFFLTIALYLVIGLLKNYLTFRRMLQAALGFVFVLTLTLLYSSPYLLVPSAQRSFVGIMTEKTSVLSQGENTPDPEGVYVKGLGNWLHYFEFYYGKPIFFFFAVGALVIGSFIGSQKSLNQHLFMWSMVLAVFLIYYVAVKPFHYMIPLAVPLYAGAFMFPALLEETALSPLRDFLSQRWVRWLVWGVTTAVIGSQFVFNLWDIFTSPYIRVAF